ncbi:Oligomerization domain-containing protein, partial [Dichotomocladium elegans]
QKEEELETLDPAEFPELFESEKVADELAGGEDDDEQVVDTEWFVDNDEEEFIPLWQRRAMDDALQDRQALEQVSKKLIETGDMSPDMLKSLLEENNMEKVEVLDVRGKCDFTNYMIVAESSMGDRLLANTAEILKQTVKKAINKHFDGDEQQKPVIRIEGLDDQSGWILVDLGHCVVHLFTPEVRERYNLEGLWK